MTEIELATSDPRAEKLPPAAFRPTWVFKGDAIERIQQLLEGAPKPWIHGCCGSAYIPGEDRRIDLYHPSGEDIDMGEIDKHIQGAGAIIMDPPYGDKMWDLPTRQRVVSACARALAPGGRLIIHAPWQPRFARGSMKLLEPMFMRDDAKLDFPMPPVLLCAYEKLQDPPTKRRRQADRKRVAGRKTVDETEQLFGGCVHARPAGSFCPHCNVQLPDLRQPEPETERRPGA